MSEERRRSHDRRQTQAGVYLDELRGLGVDVEEYLAGAVAAEKSVRDFCASRGGTIKELLPVLIARNCLRAPSVVRELFLLFVLGGNEKLLKRCADAFGRRDSGEMPAVTP